MKCIDENYYEFHEEDVPGSCFLCRRNPGRLLIVRQIKSMKMIHMCPSCVVNNLDEFLLDNTRPWKGDKEKIKKLWSNP